MLDAANPVRTDTHAQRKATVDRLTALSIRNKTNPFLDIAWPESLPEDVMWMPHKLMTVHGTQAGATLTPEQLLRLSKWESIWFYSFNVHGERHLLRDVLNCMHSPGYEDVSDYMHHFVCEENNHSWFFSNFCTRYGGKVYVDKRSQFQAQPLKPAANAFLIFARILILEEMLDYYNVIIAADEAVPAVIRELNALHHYEEARHMAFGRAIVADLFDKARKNCTDEDIDECRAYLDRYIGWCLDSLYYPAMYRDAGIADAYQFRNAVMADPGRQSHHDAMTAKVRKFFAKIGAA